MKAIVASESQTIFQTSKLRRLEQGCKLEYFQTKNHNLGKFWRVLRWKILVYFMAIWSILRLFGIFLAVCHILGLFGIYFPVLVCCTTKNLATLDSSRVAYSQATNSVGADATNFPDL
jgi:hypothetical protein